MKASEVFRYYSDERVLEEIFRYVRDREISGSFREGGYTKRPQTVAYPRDILEMVKDGVVSFHGSVERWKNPMRVRTGMSGEEMDGLRKGWDLIIDIDSSIGLEASKIAARHVLDFLSSYDLEPSLKFSGNRGFHIGVPWESMPRKVDYEPSSSQFPDIPQTIVSYMRSEIEADLFSDLKEIKGSVHELMEELEGNTPSSLSPYMFVDIEKNWGERHLFRLPYSLNEKSWLVSLPMDPDELEGFGKEQARPERVVDYDPRPFLSPAGEADELVVSALDWKSSRKPRERKKEGKARGPTKKVSENNFPPCIQLILEGLSDGRKRSILILVNFLQQMNWPWERIEEAVRRANSNNDPPLPQNYVDSQLKWFERAHQDGRKVLPPNCANDEFYPSIGICQPDERCKRGTDEIQIKNPVSYPFTTGSRS